MPQNEYKDIYVAPGENEFKSFTLIDTEITQRNLFTG